ncbi:MAG: hypothetical protein WDM89_14630 [Rhizomicrobium sp.]
MNIVAKVAIAVFFVSTGPAVAGKGGFTGSWLIAVSHSLHSNGNYCLKVTDDGSVGWPHSGFATLTGPGGLNLTFGTFQVINRIFTVTMEEQGGESGQNAGLVFSAPARAGGIGAGIYDQVYGGEAFDSGAAEFGAKGGC